jgi:pheromone shutdown protein TraB
MHKRGKLRLYDIRRVGIKGFIFSLIGAWVEKKLGEYVGVALGSEMLTAVRMAKKHNSKIALIDQDINITLKRFSKRLTWKERGRFLIDVFTGFFKKKRIPFDLRKVPQKDLVKKLINQVKKRYPSVYNVLIKERNAVMAYNLSGLMEENPDKTILAVVGAGHEEDIIELIKKGNKIEYSFSTNLK